MPASLFRDSWLVAVVVSRALSTLIFMTYAARMPVLIEAWDMSATQAGSIAGGFHFGYLISLVVFSWAADRIGALRVFLLSAALSAVSALAFALLARSYGTGVALFTLVVLT